MAQAFCNAMQGLNVFVVAVQGRRRAALTADQDAGAKNREPPLLTPKSPGAHHSLSDELRFLVAIVPALTVREALLGEVGRISHNVSSRDIHDVSGVEQVHQRENMPQPGDIDQICLVLVLEIERSGAMDDAVDAAEEQLTIEVAEAAPRFGDIALDDLDVRSISQ